MLLNAVTHILCFIDNYEPSAEITKAYDGIAKRISKLLGDDLEA